MLFRSEIVKAGINTFVYRDDIEYYSTTTGKERGAIVFLPPNYTESKKYPVLYLFHGGMGTPAEWLGGNPNEVVNNLVAVKQAREMLIVIPNIRAREDDGVPSDGMSPDHLNSFGNFLNDMRDDLMPYINEHYSVATGRENTAVAGYSMGGRTALYVGIEMADKMTNQYGVKVLPVNCDQLKSRDIIEILNSVEFK